VTRRILSARRAVVALSGIGVLLLADASAAWADPGWELEALNVPATWSESKGEGVGVAVIDSGIRVDHPALAGRAEEGPDLLGETDKAESYYGGHGTAMASHVLDVAPEARVVGLRAIRDDADPDYKDEPEVTFGGTDPIADAIATAVDANASVVLMSLGSFSNQVLSYSGTQANALRLAASQGVVVVASAGNEGAGTNDVSYPANYPGVIAVGASTRSGTRAEFSTVHSYVDVMAPGEGVSAADVATGGRSDVHGTSSAAAYVAGVAALIKSAHPDLAAWQIEEVLHRTASHYDRGHDAETGYGRVDAAAALEEAGRLEPQPAMIPPVAHDGPSHFGPGDDGTPPGVNVGLDTEMLVFAAVFGAVALVMVGLGGTLIARSRRGRAGHARPPLSSAPR
jgi:subtilisin family serine protease